jgi:hypothetical protein
VYCSHFADFSIHLNIGDFSRPLNTYAVVGRHFRNNTPMTTLTKVIILEGGSLKKNTAVEYSTRVVQEGDRRCKKSTLNDLVHLTPLRIPLMNSPSEVHHLRNQRV